jgi:hypothetical protein
MRAMAPDGNPVKSADSQPLVEASVGVPSVSTGTTVPVTSPENE